MFHHMSTTTAMIIVVIIIDDVVAIVAIVAIAGREIQFITVGKWTCTWTTSFD